MLIGTRWQFVPDGNSSTAPAHVHHLVLYVVYLWYRLLQDVQVEVVLLLSFHFQFCYCFLKYMHTFRLQHFHVERCFSSCCVMQLMLSFVRLQRAYAPTLH